MFVFSVVAFFHKRFLTALPLFKINENISFCDLCLSPPRGTMGIQRNSFHRGVKCQLVSLT